MSDVIGLYSRKKYATKSYYCAVKPSGVDAISFASPVSAPSEVRTGEVARVGAVYSAFAGGGKAQSKRRKFQIRIRSEISG
jgi:hypothetical protein